MKWILFTGTWRLTDDEVERDVRAAVREVMAAGNGVLTGGATGVDLFAMDESLKLDPAATRLRVVIPAKLDAYIPDYRAHWCKAPITPADIDALGAILARIKEVNPASLLEMPYTGISQEHYDLHNKEEVLYSDEMYAFQVNGSTGTRHTIDLGLERGLPLVLHKKYDIAERIGASEGA